MVRARSIIATLLVVALGTVVAIHCSQGEEKRVRKQFNLLSESVSKNEEETPLAMVQKARNIAKLCADDCGLEASDASLSGRYTRDEISAYAAQARLPFSRLSLRFYDLQVEFPEKGSAHVTLTARLTGTLNTGERVDETREVKSILTQRDKEWLFSDFELVEVLER